MNGLRLFSMLVFGVLSWTSAGCDKSSAPPPTPAPGDGGGAVYDPCAGKSCGDSCQVCPPDDATCMETQEVKACDQGGQCSSAPPQCDGAPPAGDYDPCAGKSCGTACTLCPPGDVDCVETQEVKVCDATGKCTSSPAECRE